ncbi:MAG TPA: hypothetical protein VKA46_41265 [Gemmataceae bacterium]|nr:hypothetical protein [Gemmataceae bacterium]
MRHVIVGLSGLFLLAAVALPARACINDREVNRSEREFKSQYLQPPPAPASEPSSPQSQGLPMAFLGGGAVLLLGATVTVLNVRKRPDPA